MVYSRVWGSRYSTILFKYAAQALKTLRILFRDKPRVVLVMTPPVVICFPVWAYTKLMNASYVIDAHTAAFVDPRWRPILFLHRFFSRHALTTIVTNEYLQNVVHAWRANATIVSDIPICFAEPSSVRLKGPCNMTVVSSFTNDEPIELFLQAACRLPEIQFYVTGSFEGVGQRILQIKRDNVEFTGYLSDPQYVGLLLASDAIISLTTLDHTMQRGAYEAVYLGKPVITSNFGVLRKAFYKGAVHVDNTVESIIRGIIQMRDHIEKYRAEVQQLRLEKIAKWQSLESELRNLLWESGHSV